MKNLIFLIILLSLSVESLAQWNPQNSGYPTQPFFDCYFIDDQNGWAVGGRRLKTTDGGETWIDKSPIFPGDWWAYCVYFFNESKGLIGGNERVYKTTNGGNSWYVVHNLLSYAHNFKSFYFIDSLKGWGAGGYFVGNCMGYTLDGGESWTEISVLTDNGLNSIAFKDSLTGFAVGNNGFVVKTTDGGNTWTQAFITSSSWWLYKVQFISESTGWILGSASSQSGVFRTTDGGNNWQLYIIGNNNPGLRTVYFIDSLHGWSGGGPIFYTSDGGENWEFVQYTSSINSIFLVNRYNGWAVGGNGLILYSTNGGIPVELISFTATCPGNSIKLKWSTSSELNNRGFEIERSTNKTGLPDGKAGWRLIGFKEGNGTTTETHNYSFVDDLYAISSPKLYYRLKQIDFDGSFEYSDIVEVDIAPSSFSLSQNYPNPFNPTTKIKYSIPNVETHHNASLQVVLKVYDVLGREVTTIVNEEKQPGVYEVEFDANNLSSGIYYYQLIAGEFIETKKLQVVK